MRERGTRETISRPGEIVVTPSQKQVEQYKRWGLTRFRIETKPGHITIDVSSLQEPGSPRFARIKRRRRDSLDVIVSSGKQKIAKAVLSDPEKILKGWRLGIYYGFRRGEIQYNTELAPLYKSYIDLQKVAEPNVFQALPGLALSSSSEGRV